MIHAIKDCETNYTYKIIVWKCWMIENNIHKGLSFDSLGMKSSANFLLGVNDGNDSFRK